MGPLGGSLGGIRLERGSGVCLFPPTTAGMWAPGASSDKSFKTRLTFERSDLVRSACWRGFSLIGGTGAAGDAARGGGETGAAGGGSFDDPPSRARRNVRGQVKRGTFQEQRIACHSRGINRTGPEQNGRRRRVCKCSCSVGRIASSFHLRSCRHAPVISLSV